MGNEESPKKLFGIITEFIFGILIILFSIYLLGLFDGIRGIINEDIEIWGSVIVFFLIGSTMFSLSIKSFIRRHNYEGDINNPSMPLTSSLKIKPKPLLSHTEPKKFLIKGIAKNKAYLLSLAFSIPLIYTYTKYLIFGYFLRVDFSSFKELGEYTGFIGVSIMSTLLFYLIIKTFYDKILRGKTISIDGGCIIVNGKTDIIRNQINNFEVDGSRIIVHLKYNFNRPTQLFYDFGDRINEAIEEFEKFFEQI